MTWSVTVVLLEKNRVVLAAVQSQQLIANPLQPPALNFFAVKYVCKRSVCMIVQFKVHHGGIFCVFSSVQGFSEVCLRVICIVGSTLAG